MTHAGGAAAACAQHETRRRGPYGGQPAGPSSASHGARVGFGDPAKSKKLLREADALVTSPTTGGRAPSTPAGSTPAAAGAGGDEISLRSLPRPLPRSPASPAAPVPPPREGMFGRDRRPGDGYAIHAARLASHEIAAWAAGPAAVVVRLSTTRRNQLARQSSSTASVGSVMPTCRWLPGFLSNPIAPAKR